MHSDMRPPVNRAMRTLDRSFFRRVVPVSAARVLNNKDIAACRSQLMKSKDALELRRASTLRPVPGPPSGLKCVLLDTNVKQDGMDAVQRYIKLIPARPVVLE
jgi:tRNA (guanine37-N1)-methyltransferase